MFKIKNLGEFDKVHELENFPKELSNQVLGDVLMFEEFLDNDIDDGNTSAVVIVDKNEIEDVYKEYPFLEGLTPEYNDITFVNSNLYVVKKLYLYNGGENGIVLYVMRRFYKEKEKFKGTMYITAHAREVLNDEFICKLKMIIDSNRRELKDQLDYLQVFEVKNLSNGLIALTHRQEQPDVNSVYYLTDVECEDCKIFWISEENEEGEEYSTLMMAEDY